MVLNPIVVWLHKCHIPRFVSVILLMLALTAIVGTIVLFAIPPLTRQTQELMRSAPGVWQGIRIRIESLTQDYPAVREALPGTEEIAGKAGAAAGAVGSILLRSTIGLVGGVASIVFAVLLLVFVLANPRPLVTAYLALTPDRYREQAHRTLARLMGQMIAWARGVAINGAITGVSIGALLWLIGVQPALIFGVFAFLGEFLPTIGAFLVSIPILLVALSMGATKFWLALAVIVLVYQIELNVLVPGVLGKEMQIASGQYLVLCARDHGDVRITRSFSGCACRRARPHCYRRILSATTQTRLRCARSRGSRAGRREKLTFAVAFSCYSERSRGLALSKVERESPVAMTSHTLAIQVERRIYLIRAEKVMLDFDLAALYGVPTKSLNLAVKRNAARFPNDFMFQLTRAEAEGLRLQIGTSNQSVALGIPGLRFQTETSKTKRGGRRYLPYAFTEQGVAMLSSVLRSKRAVHVNIAIMRTFVRLREMLLSNADLARKLAALEKKYDAQFKVVFDAIRELMTPPEKPKRQIGFHSHD